MDTRFPLSDNGSAVSIHVLYEEFKEGFLDFYPFRRAKHLLVCYNSVAIAVQVSINIPSETFSLIISKSLFHLRRVHFVIFGAYQNLNKTIKPALPAMWWKVTPAASGAGTDLLLHQVSRFDRPGFSSIVIIALWPCTGMLMVFTVSSFLFFSVSVASWGRQVWNHCPAPQSSSAITASLKTLLNMDSVTPYCMFWLVALSCFCKMSVRHDWDGSEMRRCHIVCSQVSDIAKKKKKSF